MKPIYLSLKGLNNFEEQEEIDFEKLMIGSIFGIFGPTGSGKTTIIDAITVALYGKISRYEANDANNEFINKNSDTMSVQFKFKINEDVYEVSRRYKRKKNKNKYSDSYNGGKLQKITNEESIIITEGSNEITKEIEKLIGLNYIDFCKAVILPQGKFNKFLMTKSSDRAEILERIFKLEKYGKGLNEKIKPKKKEYERILSGLNIKLEQIGEVSEEQISNKNQEIKIKSEEQINIQENIDIQEKYLIQLNKINEISNSINTLNQDRNDLLKKHDSYKNQYDINKSKRDEDLSIKKNIENNFKLLEDNKKNLLINPEKRSLINEAINLMDKLNNMSTEEKENLKKIELISNNLINDSNKLKIYKEDNNLLKDNIEKDEISLIELINNYSKFIEENIRNKEVCLNNKNIFQNNLTNKNKLKINEEKRIKLKEDRLTLNNSLHEIQQNIYKKEQELNMLKIELDDSYKSNEYAVIGSKLENGCSCPVCGSNDHPNIAKSVDLEFIEIKKTTLNDLNVDIEKLKSKYDEFNSLNLKNEVEYNVLNDDENNINHTLIDFDENIEQNNINNQEKIINDLTLVIEEIEKDKKNIEKNLESNRIKSNKYDIEIATLEANISNHEKNIFDIKEKIELSKLDIEKINLRLDELKSILNTEDISLLNEENQNKDIELNKIIKEEEILKNELYTIEKNLLYSEKELNEIDTKRKNIILIGQEKKREIEECSKKLDDIKSKLNTKAIVIEEELKSVNFNIEKLRNRKLDVAKILGMFEVEVKNMNHNLKRKLEIDEEVKQVKSKLILYSELESTLKGNKFLKYMCKRQLEYMVYDANEKLKNMTSGRYILRLDQDDFIIIDNYNEGKERRPETLSGGETFIVSLCLSLALSSSVQMKNSSSLEFFFLDEGFGTLDDKTLTTVFDCLEEFTNIGIISHVSSLKERINSKVLIKSEGYSGKRIVLSY